MFTFVQTSKTKGETSHCLRTSPIDPGVKAPSVRPLSHRCKLPLEATEARQRRNTESACEL